MYDSELWRKCNNNRLLFTHNRHCCNSLVVFFCAIHSKCVEKAEGLRNFILTIGDHPSSLSEFALNVSLGPHSVYQKWMMKAEHWCSILYGPSFKDTKEQRLFIQAIPWEGHTKSLLNHAVGLLNRKNNYFTLLTGGDHCLGLIMDGAVCVRRIIRNQLDPYPALANAQFYSNAQFY